METKICPTCKACIGEDEWFCPFCDDGLEDDPDDGEEALPWFSEDDLISYDTSLSRSTDQAVEIAIRMMRDAIGIEVWIEKSGVHRESDLGEKEFALCRKAASELLLQDLKFSVVRTNKTFVGFAKVVRLTVLVARRSAHIETEKVFAEATVIDSFDGHWQPDAIEVLYNGRIESIDYDWDEEDLPPAL